MKIKELSAEVYVITTEIGDDRGDSNFGLITWDKGALLVDADIRRWEETQRIIRSVTEKPIKYIINTHDGFDHTSANFVLGEEGAIIVASDVCRSILETTGKDEFTKKLEQEVVLGKKYKSSDMVLPDIAFSEKITLYLQQHTIEIIFLGHAHTPGDAVVYLADKRIMFAGDVVFNKCHPVARFANIPNWIKILSTLSEYDINILVPGHGEPSSGKDDIKILQQYFESILSCVFKLKNQGISLIEIEKRLDLREFEDWKKKNWVPQTIKNIYDNI